VGFSKFQNYQNSACILSQLDGNGRTIGTSQSLCIRIAHVKNVCLLCTVLRGSTARDYSIRLLQDHTCEVIGMVI